MINYIVQVTLFQVLFLVVYDFFLNKETFFKWNRFYLIATPLLSLIIPALKFDLFKNTMPQEYIVMLPEVILNPQIVIEQTVNSISSFNYLNMIFYIGMLIFSMLFLIKLFKIIKIIISNSIVKKENYKLVLLENKQSAFSFFKYIFIDKTLADKKELQIIQHELVHCKQYHTADLLFFEIFKIAMWFNPLIYIYQKRITLLHEYISDAEVVKETDRKSYFNKLLSETFNVENISFVNQFYKQSLIKKRIAMITKNKSQKMKQLKYLIMIPLLGGMLMYSSCEREKIVPNEVIEEKIEFPNNDQPLMLVNGEEVSLEFVNDLNTSRIQSINVLKGENAVKEYGEKAKNGAVQITLREDLIIEKIEINYAKTNADDVPFFIVENVPVYPGCEGGTKEELKACLNKELQKHVARKFNADLAQNLDLKPGKKRIYVSFKITKTGTIEIVGARAPHPDLEEEAIRVVNLLPAMTPGEHNGKPVDVNYMLPISFVVE